jgi:putative long chain acyl-CoA synthase
MLEGGFVIDDRLVTLADIERPILSVVGTVDEIAPAPGVRAIRLAAPRAEVYELPLPAGHFGLVVGSMSTTVTWPTVVAWARWCAADGDLPAEVKPVGDDDATSLELSPEVRSRVGSIAISDRRSFG